MSTVLFCMAVLCYAMLYVAGYTSVDGVTFFVWYHGHEHCIRWYQPV